jgi:hypothetical protein
MIGPGTELRASSESWTYGLSSAASDQDWSPTGSPRRSEQRIQKAFGAAGRPRRSRTGRPGRLACRHAPSGCSGETPVADEAVDKARIPRTKPLYSPGISRNGRSRPKDSFPVGSTLEKGVSKDSETANRRSRRTAKPACSPRPWRASTGRGPEAGPRVGACSLSSARRLRPSMPAPASSRSPGAMRSKSFVLYLRLVAVSGQSAASPLLRRTRPRRRLARPAGTATVQRSEFDQRTAVHRREPLQNRFMQVIFTLDVTLSKPL